MSGYVYISPVDGHEHYSQQGRTECVVCRVQDQRDALQARIDAYEGRLEEWEEIDRLIAASSLGGEEAQRVRDSVPPQVGKLIVRAVQEAERAERAERALLAVVDERDVFRDQAIPEAATIMNTLNAQLKAATEERDRLREAIDAERPARLAQFRALTAERDRLRAALRAVMTETGTSTLAHHYARDALDGSAEEADGHDHCDHDPIECSYDVLVGEYQEAVAERDRLLAIVVASDGPVAKTMEHLGQVEAERDRLREAVETWRKRSDGYRTKMDQIAADRDRLRAVVEAVLIWQRQMADLACAVDVLHVADLHRIVTVELDVSPDMGDEESDRG